MSQNEILKIKFTDINKSCPENVHTLDDSREFLVIKEGTIYSATHTIDRHFQTDGGLQITPDAWVQFEECQSDDDSTRDPDNYQLTKKENDLFGEMLKRRRITFDENLREYTVWDESGAHEVCRTAYPLIALASAGIYANIIWTS